MTGPMTRQKRLDLSLGDPLLPLRGVAAYAFRMASRDLNNYYNMIPSYSGPGSVRDVLHPVRDYFSARGFHDQGWSGLTTEEILPTGGGTTEGFDLALRMLSADVVERNGQGAVIKPAILMPVPTYGMFMDAAKAAGFHVVKVDRDLAAGGVLNRDTLIAAVNDAHKAGYRIIAYYDCNPHNPTGLIRGKAETESLAEVFEAINAHYAQQDLNALSINPRSRLWDHAGTRVTIIDDMVYDGLEMGDEKPFGFGQLPHMYRDTITLFGPSKAGLVGLRAGVAIGPRDKIRAMMGIARHAGYFPSTPVLHALAAYYNDDEKFAAQRSHHLARLNAQHRQNTFLMKALVNGMDTMPEASNADRAKMLRIVMKETGMDRAASRDLLTRGIKGVRIITTPQAGFFHLLDCSGLRDRQYSNEFVPYRAFMGTATAQTEEAIDHVLGAGQNLQFAYGSWAGLPTHSMIVRITCAMPHRDILETARRLAAGVKDFKKAKKVSEIQAAAGVSSLRAPLP